MSFNSLFSNLYMTYRSHCLQARSGASRLLRSTLPFQLLGTSSWSVTCIEDRPVVSNAGELVLARHVHRGATYRFDCSRARPGVSRASRTDLSFQMLASSSWRVTCTEDRGARHRRRLRAKSSARRHLSADALQHIATNKQKIALPKTTTKSSVTENFTSHFSARALSLAKFSALSPGRIEPLTSCAHVTCPHIQVFASLSRPPPFPPPSLHLAQ